jgi:hypothetical protein
MVYYKLLEHKADGHVTRQFGAIWARFQTDTLWSLSSSFSYPFPTPISLLLYSLRHPGGPYMDGLWWWWVVVVGVDENWRAA